MENQDLDIPSRPLEKRTFRNKPLDGYSKKDWLLLFMDIYRKTYMEEMFDVAPNEGFQGKVNLMSIGIGKVFGPRGWSAPEFKRFLEEQCEESVKNDFQFKVFTFAREYCEKRLKIYDRIYRQERAEDDLRQMTFHKHYQIRTEKPNDLLEILAYLDNEWIKMMYSFGIPITHKYIQIAHQKTFTEARNMILSTIKEEMVVKYSSSPELVREYFETVLENSVLWGPYKNRETIEKFYVPEDHVYDWRKDLEFIWKHFGLDKLPIWDESEKNIYWEAIPQVHKIFTKGLKRKRKKRK